MNLSLFDEIFSKEKKKKKRRITGITLRLQAKSNSDEGKEKLKGEEKDRSERKQTPPDHFSKVYEE